MLRGNRRGLGRDLGLEGRVRCRHRGPSSACTSGSARSGQGFSSSPGQDGRLGRALGPGSCESIGKRTAPTQRYCGARGRGARPPAASARRPDLPEASSAPQRCLLRFFTPTLTPGTGRESVCVCVCAHVRHVRCEGCNIREGSILNKIESISMHLYGVNTASWNLNFGL